MNLRRIIHNIIKSASPESANSAKPVEKDPILFFGIQKSGTTAIASILAQSADLEGSIDIPLFWGNRFLKYRHNPEVLKSSIKKNKRYFTQKIIKEPSITFLIPEFMQVYPGSKMVFIVRDPRDQIRSWLNRHGIPGNLDHLPEDRIAKIQPATYRASLDPGLWDSGEDQYIATLAARWEMAARLYFRFREKLILVRYEDFVSDKIRTIRTLLEQLDLEEIHPPEQFVDIQYQSKGDNSLPWEEFYGPKNLERIHYRCRDNIQKLNYSITL